MAINYKKAPVLRVFWHRTQKKDSFYPLKGYFFLYLPLFYYCKLPAIVIFKGNKKLLLLNA